MITRRTGFVRLEHGAPVVESGAFGARNLSDGTEHESALGSFRVDDHIRLVNRA